VTIFLPCLLFSQIGPLASWANLQQCEYAVPCRRNAHLPDFPSNINTALHVDIASSGSLLIHHVPDWIIIVYSLLFQLVSYAFGEVGVRLFKMPQWLT
jgi:hypothetical protein